MSINIDSCSFSLLKEIFHITEIMSADKYTRIIPYTNIYFCDFGMTIR